MSQHGHASPAGEPAFAHHFHSAEHEFESSKFGMWLFLVTEVLMFGGLFVGYIIFRNLYPDLFLEVHHALDWKMGALNTIVLLISSLTMALAIAYVQRNKKDLAVVCLIITLICGATFMGVKYIEYSHKFHDGLLPGKYYTSEEFKHPKAPLFFSVYFMMTGLHGIHVLMGMGAITWVLIRTRRGEFSDKYFTPVELVGLFWHLIDLIWIYLFPLLYLIS